MAAVSSELSLSEFEISQLSELEAELVSSPSAVSFNALPHETHKINEAGPALLTQKGLEHKKREEETQLKSQLKEIAEAVKIVFHFGSPNISAIRIQD